MLMPLLLHVGEPTPFAALFAEGTYSPARDRLLCEKVVKSLHKILALLGPTLLHIVAYGYLLQVEERGQLSRKRRWKSHHDEDQAPYQFLCRFCRVRANGTDLDAEGFFHCCNIHFLLPRSMLYCP